MNNIITYKVNDKVKATIESFNQTRRRYIIKIEGTNDKGVISFSPRYQGKYVNHPYRKGEIVTVYFSGIFNDTLLFQFQPKESNQPINDIKNLDTQNFEGVNSFSICFSESDNEYNKLLLDGLLSSFAGAIDTVEKVELAKKLLRINKSIKVRPNLAKEIFSICSTKIQMELWKDGILPYCNTLALPKVLQSVNAEERADIIAKLGVSDYMRTASVVPMFEHIADAIISILDLSHEHVRIAMAWFTNFDLFNKLKELLSRGIEVTLITNNDLINNGGYCLNFNELIDLGLELHLVEYPDMLHHKFCVVDHHTVITGSYNWTFFSEEVNRENVVFITDEDKVTDSYIEEFEGLLDKYGRVESMPDSVPERPEYDRSSFKQYISEELVARSRRRIGNQKDNIRKAISLSPSYAPVLNAQKKYDVVIDNTSRTTEDIEQEITTRAIEERQQLQNSLHQRQQHLFSQHEVVVQRVAQLTAQRQTVVQETAQRLEAAISDTERQQIRAEQDIQISHIDNEISVVETQQESISNQQNQVEQEIETTNQEIQALQQTTKIETQGGRGALKINLKWGTTDDLDLHVIGPDGYEIYYKNKVHVCQGVTGQLDIDANASSPYTRSPQENIYWEGKAPTGHYKVMVNLFSKRDTVNNIPYTVTVIPEKGESKPFPKVIAINKSTDDIVEFDITENGIEYK